MALDVMPLDLAHWDESPHDCLVLAVFKDDRPLRGAAGLADWRLCGKLTRLIKERRATAEAGETILLSPGRRLRFQRVAWFGLGEAKGYSEDRFKHDLTWMLRVVTALGAADWSVQLPGRARGLIEARRAVEILLEEPRLADQPIALLEDPAAQKIIADLVHPPG